MLNYFMKTGAIIKRKSMHIICSIYDKVDYDGKIKFKITPTYPIFKVIC